MKIVLTTFADDRYKPSLKRILGEVSAFPFISDTYAFNESDIDKEYLHIIKPHLYRRGFGYWRWKPYFVLKVMNTLSWGDIMIWSDAGNVLNSSAANKLRDYIQMAMNSKVGIFAFEQQGKIEEQWTKRELLDFFNAPECIRQSPQLWGGAFVMVKTQQSMDLVNKWYSICKNKGYLVDDSRELPPPDR